MSDPIYIDSSEFKDIISDLQKMKVNAAHFTNGTFALAPKLIVPTTLAGFKRVTKTYSRLPLVIAVNSDKSMAAMGKTGYDNQQTRAEKVAIPLQQVFPKNKVIVVYYDEDTPFELYEALSKQALTRTLHKWGYGTSEDAPMIKGAEFFELVYGFPLPNDKKPLCYDISVKADKPQSIIVDDLRDELINADNKVLFKLPHSLKEYEGKVHRCDCSIL